MSEHDGVWDGLPPHPDFKELQQIELPESAPEIDYGSWEYLEPDHRYALALAVDLAAAGSINPSSVTDMAESFLSWLRNEADV